MDDSIKIDLSGVKTSEHISFSSSDAINQICAPLLAKLNLNAFSYSRIYIDGSRLELWTDAYALEHTFIKKPYLINVYSPDLIGKDRYCMYEYKVKGYSSKLVDLYFHQLNDQKQIFNHANCFVIIERTFKYTEYYIFYGPKECLDTVDVYFNNIDELENFIKYFIVNARDIIKKADVDRLIPAWRNIDPKIITRKEYIPKNDLLSPQERKIAYLLVTGKNAKEIAFLISVSPKTAENHVYNIKRKIGVSKKSDLIKILYQMGYKPLF